MSIVEMARDADTAAPGARPDERRIFKRVDDGAYVMALPGILAELSVDHLRREGGSLIGELAVRCWLPGARGVDGVISIADLTGR